MSMSALTKALKNEIEAVTKKQINTQTAELKKQLKQSTQEIRQLQARVDTLRKTIQNTTFGAPVDSGAKTTGVDKKTEARFSSASIKSMRKRLGISQAELARLVGASLQTVSVWENKKGRVVIRSSNVRDGLASLKQAKKADISAQLGKQQVKKNRKASKKKSGSSDITGTMIKNFREQQGLSQSQLARLAGVSNQVVSVWEAKKNGALTFRGSTEKDLKSIMKMKKGQISNKIKRM